MKYERLTVKKVDRSFETYIRVDKNYILSAYDIIDEEKQDLVEILLNRLVELEDKIENGTLIEVDDDLIGQCVIGIHKYTNGTYSLDLDENLVIGFADNGIVTWNNSHGFNDWFRNDLYFIDNEQGRAEAEKKLKELKGE